jgi:hypothetical protein
MVSRGYGFYYSRIFCRAVPNLYNITIRNFFIAVHHPSGARSNNKNRSKNRSKSRRWRSREISLGWSM